MPNSDFLRLSKADADDYIRTQPIWRRSKLAAAWEAGSAERIGDAAPPSPSEGSPKAAFYYRPAFSGGRLVGGLLMVGGVVCIVFGLTSPTTVTRAAADYLAYSPDVFNLDAGLRKITLLISGFGAFLAGVGMHGFAVVADRVREGVEFQKWLAR